MEVPIWLMDYLLDFYPRDEYPSIIHEEKDQYESEEDYKQALEDYNRAEEWLKENWDLRNRKIPKGWDKV